MAATIPAALKSADVQRYATRAAQLEKYKPIATYWLEYYVLQQILSKQLHASSAEVGEYAVQLMDKVEETKTRYANEAAISDDVVAKAYMEQFASETFKRAEASQNSDQVTRQTADTFQAAATFYDSLAIWGELDQESKAKSKFAKFHALRIARALKEGKDPNESNPRVEVPVDPAEDDELEAELKKISSGAAPDGGAAERNLTAASTSSICHAAESIASPVDAEAASNNRPASIGGGYFPSAPSAEAKSSVQPASSLLASPQVDGDDHISTTEVNPMQSPQTDSDTHVPASPPEQPQSKAINEPAQLYGAVAPTPQPVRTAGTYKTDDEAVMEAQKHAKWAISALNFEDVPTAVNELRTALQALGGL